jgi:hypothetical protein
MRFVSKIDTSQIPISRTVFEQLTDAPAGAIEGRYYYDLNSRLVKYFDNSTWRTFVTFSNAASTSILLNPAIKLSAENANGGISVARLAADNTTRQDVALQYNITSNTWTASYGPTTAAPVTKKVALVHSENFGDGVTTSYTIHHELATRNVVVSVREIATGEIVGCDTTVVDENNVILSNFNVVPTSNQFNATIIG